MTLNASRFLSVLIIGFVFHGYVFAGLIDRGSGMVYDDVLDITWLKDANYAFTSGYASTEALGGLNSFESNVQSDGRMGWQAAMNWAGGLSFGGFDDWRLASIKPLNGTDFSYNQNSKEGTKDFGYNITSTQSELAYMFNVNLGLESFFNTNDTRNVNWVNYFGQVIPDTGLIANLMGWPYWSNTQDPQYSGTAWFFNAGSGDQGLSGKGNSYYAWAVRDGDVASGSVFVSEPQPITIFLLGFLVLVARIKSRANPECK